MPESVSGFKDLEKEIMKKTETIIFRFLAVLSVAVPLWSCKMEEPDRVDYHSDLEYYGSNLKSMLLKGTLCDGMEMMMRLNVYLGLTAEERESDEWKAFGGSVKISGEEGYNVTMPSCEIDIKNGTLLTDEGAEWTVRFTALDYPSYYYYERYLSASGAEGGIHMTVRRSGENSWTFEASAESTGQFNNLEYSGNCAVSYSEELGFIKSGMRIWTFNMKGTTSEDSGYSSEFRSSDDYTYTVLVNETRTISEKGMFTVDFFKDKQRFDSVSVEPEEYK